MTAAMQLDAAGIQAQVVKKAVKNLRITVLPPDGTVRVTAPYFLPDREVAAFVAAKAEWIRRQQARFAVKARQAAPEYISGEPVYIWGRLYTLQLTEGGGKNGVHLEGAGVVLHMAQAGSTLQQRQAVIEKWQRCLLRKAVDALMPTWEARTGLFCSAWQIRRMRTRWGSCNTRTGKIWLALQLAEHPPECLEYVLLHELVHLRIRGHGADFKAFLSSYMPDWKKRQKKLNAGLEPGPL